MVTIKSNHAVAIDGYYECKSENGLRHYETALFHIADQEDSAHCIICRAKLKYPEKNSMTELEKCAQRLHEQCVIEISRFRGRTHASLREAAFDYGLRAGLTKDEISLNLRTACVKYEDVENTIAALDIKRERK